MAFGNKQPTAALTHGLNRADISVIAVYGLGGHYSLL